MIWKRFLPVLACGLLLIPWITTTARGGLGLGEVDRVAPTLSASVSYAEDLFRLEVTGPQGASGFLHVFLLFHGSSGPVVEEVDLPIVLDANGSYTFGCTLTELLPVDDFDVVFHAVFGGSGASSTVSTPSWGFRKRSFDATDPAAPAAPSGGSGSYPLPGTVAPLFPYTWGALPSGNLIVQFQCAIPGIEGVIPVN